MLGPRLGQAGCIPGPIQEGNPGSARGFIQKKLGDLGKSGVIRNSAHNVFNPIIDVEGDTATGHWRLLMLYTGVYPGGELHYSRIIGWYRETYARIEGRWQFTSQSSDTFRQMKHAPRLFPLCGPNLVRRFWSMMGCAFFPTPNAMF